MLGKKVIFGINNSLDAKVACLLLKKQGFEVFPYVVITSDANTISNSGNAFSLRCSNLDLRDLQDFCQKNSLQLLATDAKERFNDEVVDNYVSTKLMGMTGQACFRCNSLKLNLMYDKMVKLKFDYIATGHYAKIYLNKEINQYNLYRSFEGAIDQSHLLAHLSQDILSHLLLPLSDIQKSNIFKIAESLGVTAKNNDDIKKDDCFNSLSNSNELIDSKVAPDLLLAGEVINFDTDKILRDHPGLHNFQIGQSVASLSTAILDVDKNLVVYKIEPNSKTVFVRNKKSVSFLEFTLHDISLHQSYPRDLPQEVFVKINNDAKVFSGISFLKNNNRVVIKLNVPCEEFLSLGDRVVVYNKDNGMSKVLLTGTLSEIGPFKNIDRIGRYREEGEECKSEDGDIFGF